MNVQVLIMDDESEYGELISDIAESMNLKAVASTDGNQFEELMTDDVQLVFLDLHMPERDGIELLRVLSDQGYQGGVVLMSGFDEAVLSTAHELAEKHGLNLREPLTKPFRMQQIVDVFNNENLSPANADHGVDLNSEVVALLPPEELQAAIDEGRIIMHYQPQVSLKTYQVIGFEALVRLVDTEGALVYPDHFILTAEQSELIDQLTEIVIEQVLDDYSSELKKFGPVTVSINVSALNLKDLNFPDRLNQAVKDRDIDARNIVVEITESSVFSDEKTNLDILTRLRLKNFKLSIDDFGTGAAVLDYIKRFPFTELKIDKSFIDNLLSNYKNQLLVKNTIEIAHGLNMDVVAEGVEDWETVQYLKSAGCNLAQGYYFSRPLPLQELIESLTQSDHNNQASIYRELDIKTAELVTLKPDQPEDTKLKEVIDQLIQNPGNISTLYHDPVISILLPLTGPLAMVGQSLLTGLRTSISAYNNANSERSLDFEVYDTNSKTDRLVQLTKKTISQKSMGLMGCIFPLGDVERVVRLLNQTRKPMLSPYAGCSLLRQSGYTNIFNSKASYLDELDAILQVMEKEGGDCAMIYPPTIVGNRLKNHAAKQMKNMHFIKHNQMHTCDDFLKDLKKKDVDNLLVIGSHALLSSVVNKYQKLKPTAYFYGISLISPSGMQNLLSDSQKNVFLSTPIPDIKSDTPVARKFRENLEEAGMDVASRYVNTISLEGFISGEVWLPLLQGFHEEGGDLTVSQYLNRKLRETSNIGHDLDIPMQWNESERQLVSPINIIRYHEGSWNHFKTV
ncbi:EAL domain-containing protein [Thiomicrorhabdus sp. ZW0627]|uniref:EAL domain-containing protein n=1 Tax=Thiomicrorhabdus sp. ZW0627 TaxID=3039774 RepID=UPI002436FEB4|nr:EAL domain-containing protein [Thiomicrorhabdus sp. ZW0627]MDG6772714.1 EAL domain-containing protein [Thiomicrorhabdus sp. ZW0627]